MSVTYLVSGGAVYLWWRLSDIDVIQRIQRKCILQNHFIHHDELPMFNSLRPSDAYMRR